MADLRVHGLSEEPTTGHAGSARIEAPATQLSGVLPAGKHAARGLYVHVPFCFHKCHYCDFYSFVDREARSGDFLTQLERDVTWSVDRLAGALDTIFIGGGTPTLLTADELRILCAQVRRFPRNVAIEWTVEANPETIDEEKARVLVEGGVNRVSIGAQSFDPKHLKTLERWHDPANVVRAAQLVRGAGITNFNLDLIFGIPGQTLDDWRRDLERALALEPTHLSCYGLTYEPNTAMTKRREMGQFEALDDALEAQMYEVTVDTLAAAGYAQYEISNYAKSGRECQHNLVYWRNQPWMAIGPSASGFLAGHRYKVLPRLGDWLARTEHESQPIVDHEAPDVARHVSEAIMLGLRLTEGIDAALEGQSVTLVPRRAEVFSRAIRDGLLERDAVSARLRLTRQGSLLANTVLSELM